MPVYRSSKLAIRVIAPLLWIVIISSYCRGDVYVASIIIDPNPIYGLYWYTGTVVLGGSDANLGYTVTLGAAPPMYTPPSVTVPQGSNIGTWTWYTTNTPVTATCDVTASVGNSTLHTQATVLPITIASVTFSPAAVRGPGSFTGTVTLNHALPATYSGQICLSASRQCITIPPVIDIGAGESSASFTGTAGGVSDACTLQVQATLFCDPNYSGVGTITVDPNAKDPEPADSVTSAGGGGGGAPTKQCLHCGDNSLVAWIDFRSGNVYIEKTDPIATRGYPLTCNISFNSQGVETGRPMGNATFTYDIHVSQQMIYASPGNGSLHWIVMDGDGSRPDFGSTTGNPSGLPGIFSHLTLQGGGYVLSGAGPPEDVKSAGNFTYYFDSNGKLTQIVDPAGNPQNLTYTSGQLASVTDANTGKQISFTWTGGYISQVNQGGGAVKTNLIYNGGQLSNISVTNSSNQELNSVQYNYTNGQLSSITKDHDSGTALNFTYTDYASTDGANSIKLANENDSEHATNIIWGNAPGAGAAETVVVKNAAGNATTYDFNAAGDVIKITTPTLTGASGPTVVQFTYDANRQVTSTTTNGVSDGTVVYNSLGLPTSATNQLGNVWSWSYLGADLQTAQDPVQFSQGRQETLTYGDVNQPHIPTLYTDANNFAWNFGHNIYGQTTSVTPPAGSPLGTTTVVYDETPGSPTLGYPLQVTDANGNKVTFDGYDNLGDLTQISTYADPNDITTRHITLFGFDAVQRPTFVQHPDTTAFQWFYVGRNLDHTIDEAGTRFNFTYCAPCDALEGISGPLGWTLGWTYNGDKQLSRFTDARGKQTNYTYGPGNELTTVTYPDNSTLSFLYDNFGRVRQATNGRSQNIVPTYDTAERVSQISFPTTGATGITIHYNTDDTVHDVVDAAGTTTYSYLPTGQLSSVIYNYSTSGLTNPQELDYTYYADGSRSSLTWKNNGTVVASWNYNYDAGGRLASVSNNFGENTSWVYDGEGKIKQQINSNNTTANYVYNELRGWPISITYKQGATVFASYSLTYDNGFNTVGNLTGVSENSGSTTTYGYDALYRLASDNRTAPNPTSHTYGYDLAGNITLVNGSTFMTYDNANKIASIPGGSVAHDGDGNLTSMSGTGFFSTTFTWDDLSRLSSHTVNNKTLSFKYDFAGRRIMQQLNSNVKQFFIFDGDTMIGQIQGNNQANAAFTWGANGPISWRKIGSPNQSLWYDFGPQGETRHLTNSAGNIIDTYLYSSYGVRTYISGPDSSGLMFGGQFGGYYSDFNTDAGTIYCRNRWYHPKLGRWISRDPVDYDGGPNLYDYCGGDPINQIDPLGFEQVKGGHHFVTWNVRGDPDLSEAAWEVFDSQVTGSVPGGHNASDGHVPYNKAVKDLWDKWIVGKDKCKLTKEEAMEFVDLVKNSKNPAIRYVLDNIALRFAMVAVHEGDQKAASAVFKILGEKGGKKLLAPLFKRVPFVSVAFAIPCLKEGDWRGALGNVLPLRSDESPIVKKVSEWMKARFHLR